jgi:starvation-inducible DNA-binding protein
MIQQLIGGQESVVRTARGLVPLVDKAGDEPTADLLTQRLQIHEKNAWMLRSLLETDAPAIPAVSERRKKR